MNPDYPMPPGGKMPDLNLAGIDGWMPDVASGSSIEWMPTPPKPPITWPTLSGSPDLGGVDPGNIIPDLNLAGVDGVPAPDVVAMPSTSSQVHLPDYGVPDMMVPGLQAGRDLTGPGIDQLPEWNADPMTPDLSEYRHPHGLDIMQPSVGMSPDPLVAFDHPYGLDMMLNDVTQPDPMVPDLQHPDLTQEVHMSTRPGDLDTSALNVMDGSQTAQLIKDKDYPEVQMDQRGYNNTRSRHMTMMMDGLRDEEK